MFWGEVQGSGGVKFRVPGGRFEREKRRVVQWKSVASVARTFLAAGASAGVMFVARRFGFAAQGFELIPGFDIVTVIFAPDGTLRAILRWLRIQPVIPKRGTEEHGLGACRWFVERTISWLHQFRRLRIRWDRRPEIHQAFLTLAAGIICYRFSL